MLKQRVITAIAMGGFFLGVLFFASAWILCLVTMLITLWAGWEWSQLMGLKQWRHRCYYLVFLLSIMLGIFCMPIPVVWCVNLLWATFFFWLMMIPLVVSYPKTLFWKKSVVAQGVIGAFVLIPLWFTLNFVCDVDPHGAYLLLFLLLLVWTADTAAYFIGRRFGKTPLLIQVSPGKTWEGVYGAVGAGLLLTFIPLLWLKIPYHAWFYVLLLSFVTILFSVVGDLLESMFKRSEGLKDSGCLLPGHGGLLDRIDSLTAAVPVFILGTIILSKMNI